MMKKFALTLCTAMAILFTIGTTEVKAEEADAVWNYEKEITETAGAFTYHAFTSYDEKEVWLYEISIDKKKSCSQLSIPETLDNKTVTRIGYTVEKDEDSDEWNKNIFGEYVETYHHVDGGEKLPRIKEISIPDTVEVIQPTTFSGADYITTIKIPNKVTVLEGETFYDCDRLKTIQLPDDLMELNIGAFENCPKLKTLKLSSKNKVYRIKNKCIITRKEQALIYVLPSKGTFKIPNGIKVIKAYAFDNCTASKLYIPASVKKIEENAFVCNKKYSNKKIKDISISKKNKTYAKDGQCIYNKKDKTLSVAIPNSKGELYISNKVRHLTEEYSIVNCDMSKKHLKKVVLPKKLKTVTGAAFMPLTSFTKKVYFMGTKPPKMKDLEDKYEPLPRDTDVYVPKKSYNTYKKWYKGYDALDDWTKLYKFNP